MLQCAYRHEDPWMAVSTASDSGSRSLFETMTRRTFIAASASALQARERVRREIFLRSPDRAPLSSATPTTRNVLAVT